MYTRNRMFRKLHNMGTTINMIFWLVSISSTDYTFHAPVDVNTIMNFP
jgi:hypothetical protein